MGLEQKINYQLNKFPFIKKGIKRFYQLAMFSISRKIKSEGNIRRVSPDDKNHEFFFGYYDKCPWDMSGRYILCMRAKDTWTKADPLGKIDILRIDTTGADATLVLATSHCWNVQQGCMAQWLGPDYKSKIIYNDIRNGKYVSVVLEIETRKETVFQKPVYTVSTDGKIALSLDFSRLHNLRPGYGYAEIPETTKGIPLPDSTAVWKIDLESGSVTELLKYTDFVRFQPRPEMKEEGSVHKVNHLILSPNGKRFMVLYRWFCGQRKYTRLITCDIDGKDMYLLSDDDMVSHCYWKNDSEILGFERKKKGGPGYYLMKDKTQEWTHLWPKLSNDGHPSYSPVDNNIVVFDTYPNKYRIQEVKVANDQDVLGNEISVIAKFFAPFKYDNDTRCDLHPRWSRDGNKVCVDAVFEGHRGLYEIQIY